MCEKFRPCLLLFRVDGQGTKWFKFEDGEVGEARMEDDEELKSQCFGGEFMGETYDHVMKRFCGD